MDVFVFIYLFILAAVVLTGEDTELLVGLKNDGMLDLLSNYLCNESTILGYNFSVYLIFILVLIQA